jgi:type I restriction enzyme, S subunit
LGDKVVEPRFLIYYLNHPNIIGWIQKRAIGATLPNLNTSIIRDIPISYPPIPIQRRIADILSAYDDLIENNTHRIHILEGMARTIYREWFGKVDKESLPKSWKVDTLENHISVDRGVSHKGEYMNGKGLPLLNLKSFSIGGGYRTDGLKSYSGEYKSKHVVQEILFLQTQT